MSAPTTTIFQNVMGINTDAEFRTFCTAISSALTTMGLLKTADTGQVSWDNTQTAPTANYQYSYYEVRQFQDTATFPNAPVFIKIGYGCGNAVNTFSLQVTVSTGTDGAGNLTGNVSAVLNLLGYGNDTNVVVSHFLSSDGKRLSMAFAPAISYTSFGFSIERTKDHFGQPTDEGVNFVFASYQNVGQQFIPKASAGIPIPPLREMVSAMPGNPGPFNYGLNFAIFPISPYFGYIDNPDMGSVIMCLADYVGGAGLPVKVAFYGATHTYVLMPSGPINNIQSNGNGDPKLVGWRFE